MLVTILAKVNEAKMMPEINTNAKIDVEIAKEDFSNAKEK